MKYRLKYLGVAATIALVTVGLSASILHSRASSGGNGTLSLSPSSGSVTVGGNLVIAIHENSGPTPISGVQAVLTYNPAQLQFISADANAPFSVAPPDSASGGSLQIVRGAYSGQTNDQVVSDVTFKSLTAGSATVSFNQSSTYASATSDGSHLSESYTNGNYTINAAVTPSCPSGDSGTYPNCVAPTRPTCPAGYSGVYPACVAPPVTAPTLPTAPSGTTKGSSVTVTPQSGAGGAVTLPNNSTAAINTPVDVQPTTVQADGVKSVQYYLNGKLVATETTAPYTYHVNTKNLKSGTYHLQTKTNYSNGTSKSSTQNLIVKNASAKKSGSGLDWLILLILIAVVLALLYITLRRRRPPVAPSSFTDIDDRGTQPLTPPATQTIVPDADEIPEVTTVATPAPLPTPEKEVDPVPDDDTEPLPTPTVSTVSAVPPGSVFKPELAEEEPVQTVPTKDEVVSSNQSPEPHSNDKQGTDV